MLCPNSLCGGSNIAPNGNKNGIDYVKCKDCGKQFQGKIINSLNETGKKSTADGETTLSDLSKNRITSLQELIDFFEIDIKYWRIKTWRCGSYESHTRIRNYKKVETIKKCPNCSTEIKIKTTERAPDKHKVVPMYKISCILVENNAVRLIEEVKEEILSEFKKQIKKIPLVKYPATHIIPKLKCALEINVFDLHFGKLTWAEETGHDYDVNLAKELFTDAIAKAVEQANNYPISKVIFPVGNDFFNVDNKSGTTSAGTPQQEDTRWKKTFRMGRQLIVEELIKLSSIAPVEVVVVPGNHDYERSFYLGDALECFFVNYLKGHISIDNSASVRKYVRWGNCLIGYTHGRYEKLIELPILMSQERRKDFAETEYHEWHLGDKHHKKEMKWLPVQEVRGAHIRYLRSLTPPDSWHYDRGYKLNVRGIESFIWDYNEGMIAHHFTNYGLQ